MKKIYLLLLLVTGAVMAQIPQGFSYQAVALNASGQAVASAPVKIRLSILDNSATGTAVYTETHNPTTNNVGLFNLTIGQGTPVTGTFAGINWAQNSKFLKVEIDVANGNNYVTVGSSQLLAVPYAMFAGAVAGMGGSTGTVINSLYLYGSFNSFNTATALQMPAYPGIEKFKGFKYFTTGTQLKFITSPTPAAIPYGNTGSNQLGPNGVSYNINSTGLYRIGIENYGPEYSYNVFIQSIGVEVETYFNTEANMTYNAATGILSAIVNVPATTDVNYRKFTFNIVSGGNERYGDNLANGTIEDNGTPIAFPGTGNYKIDLNLNFTGEGSTYTITPL
jgi:hypothetical protein